MTYVLRRAQNFVSKQAPGSIGHQVSIDHRYPEELKINIDEQGNWHVEGTSFRGAGLETLLEQPFEIGKIQYKVVKLE